MAAVRTTRLNALRAPGAARVIDAIAHVPPDTLRHLMAGIRWAVTLLDPPRPTNHSRPQHDDPCLRERYLR